MKTIRIFAFLLALLMIGALISCSAKTPQPSPSSAGDPPSASADSGSGAASSGETPAQSDPSSAMETSGTPDDADRAFLSAIPFPSYLPAAEGEAYFFGRWYEKEIDSVPHKVTVTDGAQIFFLVENTASVVFDFTVITKYETPYFAVSIDGGEPARQMITEKTVALPDTGKHVLRVFADGMVEGEGRWSKEIGFALKTISVDKGGRLRGVVPQNKTVFFYGDSITEGICALRNVNTSSSNSATSAYPYFCSQKLGVIPYYVGYSGSGVTVDGSFNIFQNAIDHFSLSRKADLSVKPDLIVINHGTNDGGATSSSFKKALKRALNTLVKCYPGVPIVYAIPFHGTHKDDITAVAEEFDVVTIVPTSGWNLSYSDGLHPDKAGAKRAGQLLAANIEKIYGKDFFTVGQD